MGQPFQSRDTALEIIEGQIRECFGRAAYSQKTHEKAGDSLLTRLRRIKLWQIVLSAVVTGGLVTTLLGDARVSRSAGVVSAVVSAALLALNAYTKDSDPGRAAQEHKVAADALWVVRESYLSLLTDIRAGNIPIERVQVRRDELQAELGKVYAAAPRTDAKAYAQAGVSLKSREELTFADDEIDKFLPRELRRTRSESAGDSESNES